MTREAFEPMKSSTFYCPHCQANLTKSAAAQVLGDVKRFIVLGSPPKVTCPACGGDLDARAMIDGQYDKPPGAGDWVSGVASFVFLIVTIGLAVWGLSFWVAIIIGLVAAGLFSLLPGRRGKKEPQSDLAAIVGVHQAQPQATSLTPAERLQAARINRVFAAARSLRGGNPAGYAHACQELNNIRQQLASSDPESMQRILDAVRELSGGTFYWDP
jgi:hypothetical protein